MAKLPPKELEDYREIASKIAPQLRDFNEKQLRELVDNIPYSWRILDEKAPKEPLKKRVTMYIDADMLKFFQQNDTNWQGRVREILRGFMALQLKKHLKKEMPTPREIIDQWLNIKPEKLKKRERLERARQALKDQVDERAIDALIDVARSLERFAEFHEAILRLQPQQFREVLDSEKERLIPDYKGDLGKYNWRARSAAGKLSLRVVIERINRIRAQAGVALLDLPEELKAQTEAGYEATFPHEYHLYKSQKEE